MKEEYKKSNFAAAFIFLNKNQRYALSVIYSFMRYADDAADKEKNINYINDLREKISDIYLGKSLNESFFEELKNVINEYKIPKYVFIELLRGIEKDISEVDIKNLSELEDYMYCVAGTVGEVVLRIVNYQGKDANQIARFTGYAVQLTNILRDIKEDLNSKKIYIPLQDRLRFLKTANLDINNPGFKDLFNFQKELAISYYKISDELFMKNKTKELFVPSFMKNLYRQILYSLSFDNLEKNHKISKYKKVKAFIRSIREIL